MNTRDTINRADLYALIWEKPATKIAAEFGISGSMLARICTELNVPRPKVGYWTKIAHGMKPRRPKLPKLKEGAKDVWTINRRIVASQRSATSADTSQNTERHEPQHRAETLEALEADLADHRLVRDTRTALRGEKPDEKGLLSPKQYLRHLPITLSKETTERALGFLNRLIHVCKGEGIKIESQLTKNPPLAERKPPYDLERGSSFFRWEDEVVGFHLREKHRRELREETASSYWKEYDYFLEGKLEFTLEVPWRHERRRTWGGTVSDNGSRISTYRSPVASRIPPQCRERTESNAKNVSVDGRQNKR